MKTLVLVGAGHAHARVLLDLARNSTCAANVVLVSPTPLAPYSGMVPGWMAGHYRWEECCIDFAHLCRTAGATLRIGMVTAIDTAASRLHLDSGESITYDMLSLDIGSTAAPPATDRVPVLAMRPLTLLKKRWDALRADVCALAPGATYRVLMVGAGAAGAESILAARNALQQCCGHVRFEFTLATQGPRLLPALAKGASRRIAGHLKQSDIEIVYGFEAATLNAHGAQSPDGRVLGADVVLWATGAVAHGWPASTALARDGAGFISVDETLQSVSHPNVFAAGDCASLPDGVPKAGVFAVRMGPVLSHNLRAALSGLPLVRFRPQRRYLVLLGTGGTHAVAAWGAFSWEGAWVWRWKQRIDRRFLKHYNGASKRI